MFAFLFFYFFYRSKDDAQSIAQLFAIIGLFSGILAVLLIINPLEFLGYQFGRENYLGLWVLSLHRTVYYNFLKNKYKIMRGK